MSPSMTPMTPQSTYTPEQMRQVLEEALSPIPAGHSSPLLNRRGTSHTRPDSGHKPSNSSSPIDSGRSSYVDGMGSPQRTCNARTPLMKTSDKMLHTPRLAPGSSPVRPLPSSPPTRDEEGTEERTFEVEASFLQAMIGLLHRQANIVPDHMLTKSDVRKIVRKELEEQAETKAIKKNAVQTKCLADFITPSRVLAVTAGVAGLVVLIRAKLRHPEEVAWIAGGAWKGGVCGFVGAMTFKGLLWGIESMRSVRTSASVEEQA